MKNELKQWLNICILKVLTMFNVILKISVFISLNNLGIFTVNTITKNQNFLWNNQKEINLITWEVPLDFYFCYVSVVCSMLTVIILVEIKTKHINWFLVTVLKCLAMQLVFVLYFLKTIRNLNWNFVFNN